MCERGAGAVHGRPHRFLEGARYATDLLDAEIELVAA
jgi:hypothetical protein